MAATSGEPPWRVFLGFLGFVLVLVGVESLWDAHWVRGSIQLAAGGFVEWLIFKSVRQPLKVIDTRLGVGGKDTRITRRLAIPAGRAVVGITVSPNVGGDVVSFGFRLLRELPWYQRWWVDLATAFNHEYPPGWDSLAIGPATVQHVAIERGFYGPIEFKLPRHDDGDIGVEIDLEPPFPQCIKGKPFMLRVEMTVVLSGAKFDGGFRALIGGEHVKCRAKLETI